MNIILGRNGYGKTYLLRLVLSLLQKNNEKADEFFQDCEKESYAMIQINRNSEDYLIHRVKTGFEKSVGKIPVLAIPDVRFIDKSGELLGIIDSKEIDLVNFGAYNFLYEKKDEMRINAFLYELCISYLENNKSFQLELFDILKNVIYELTGNIFEFEKVEVIQERAFKLYVIDNDMRVLFQKISQGTLSVLTIFGLIYRYLKSIFPDSEKPTQEHAIVFIDEIDAHLHPVWQQKIISLLRQNFPNIQFFLSSHSPLVVAGCLEREVSVLRKNSNGKYTLYQFERDFIGWSPEKLYKQIFEIEEMDETYFYYSALSPFKKKIKAEIEELERKEYLSVSENERLKKLSNDLYYIEITNEIQRNNSLDLEYI